MAPSSRTPKPRAGGAKKSTSTPSDGGPPKPYRLIPESLKPFVEVLSPKHIYIAHVDTKPAILKRKMFLVPVTLNILVVLAFVWRVNYIGPYYVQLLGSALGQATPTTVDPASHTWPELIGILLARGFTLMLDLVLVIFVWPWPVEFCLGRAHGNPLRWRWAIGGFRKEEIYVRRSRSWDVGVLGGAGGRGGPRKGSSSSSSSSSVDVLKSAEARALLMAYIVPATNPIVLAEKTGYLTMNGDWDLDWDAMVHATRLVDGGRVALEAFLRVPVLLFHEEHGWMCLDLDSSGGPSSSSSFSGGASGRGGTNNNDSGTDKPEDDERRRQVFAFRDALSSIGKEDLFFRWIEVVQFETTQPGGFTEERQVVVAKQIRELFQSNGIDFDALWQEAVGSEGLAGMS